MIQMTRDEYEQKYGAKPTTNQPIQMTRQQYQQKYGGTPQSSGGYRSDLTNEQYWTGTAKNILPSAGRTAMAMGSGILNMANPNVDQNTLAQTARLAYGGLQKLDPTKDKVISKGIADITPLKYVSMADKGRGMSTDYQPQAEAVGKFYGDRYGGVENIKKSAYEDPVGVALDASVFLGGAGAGLKGVGGLAKSSRLARAGEIASMAGKAIDPISMTGKVGKALVGKPLSKMTNFFAKQAETMPTRGMGNPTLIGEARGMSPVPMNELFEKYNLWDRSPETFIGGARKAGNKLDDMTTAYEKTSTIKPVKVPKIDPLLSEAKKYKSAEEFVKAQINAYHGTNKSFDKFELTEGKRTGGMGAERTVKNNAIFLSNDRNVADFFGKNRSEVQGGYNRVIEAKIPQDKILDLNKLPSDVKRKAIDLVERWTGDKHKSIPADLRSWLVDQSEFVDLVKSKGFKGVRFNEGSVLKGDRYTLKTQGGNYTTAIFDPKDILTKSQLTDIWNQAQGERKIAPNTSGRIDVQSILDGLDKKITKLQRDSKYSNTASIELEELMSRRDRIAKSFKSTKLAKPTTMTYIKNQFQKDVPDSQFGLPTNETAKAKGAKTAYKQILTALEDKIPGTKGLGREASSMRRLFEASKNARDRQMAAQPIKMKGLLSAGAGATIGGIPGAVGGYVLNEFLNSPTFLKYVTKGMTKMGKTKLPKTNIFKTLINTGKAIRMTNPK